MSDKTEPIEHSDNCVEYPDRVEITVLDKDKNQVTHIIERAEWEKPVAWQKELNKRNFL